MEYRLTYYYPSRNTSHPDSSEYHVVSERIRLIRHIHVDPTVCTLTCQFVVVILYFVNRKKKYPLYVVIRVLQETRSWCLDKFWEGPAYSKSGQKLPKSVGFRKRDILIIVIGKLERLNLKMTSPFGTA